MHNKISSSCPNRPRPSCKQWISYEWKNFAKHAYKIAVDIDEGELRKPTLANDYSIHADVKDVLNELLNTDYVADEKLEDWIQWAKDINHRSMERGYLLREYDKRCFNG